MLFTKSKGTAVYIT